MTPEPFKQRQLEARTKALASLERSAVLLDMREPWGGHIRVAFLSPTQHSLTSLHGAEAPFDAMRCMLLAHPGFAARIGDQNGLPGSILGHNIVGADFSTSRIALAAFFDHAFCFDPKHVQGAPSRLPYLDAGAFWIGFVNRCSSIHKTRDPLSTLLPAGMGMAISQDQESDWPPSELAEGARNLSMACLLACPEIGLDWTNDPLLSRQGRLALAHACKSELVQCVRKSTAARKPSPSL